MPASFFPASGTLLQLHIYASRCKNMHRHMLILRVFAGEGVSAAVYASLRQMTTTALLSAHYATPAVLTRLFSLTEEPVWCRRKGFSASSPSLFRHAAEALPQPRKHTERAFPHAARSAGHLPGGHERAENGASGVLFRDFILSKTSQAKSVFLCVSTVPRAFAVMCPRLPIRRSRQASALRHERGRAVSDQGDDTVKKSVCLMES